MADIENDGPETRSRKRRSSGNSALTDISNMGSNFIQQSYEAIKKTVVKKRRTSGEDVASSRSGLVATVTVTTTANPVSSSSSFDQTTDENSRLSAESDLQGLHFLNQSSNGRVKDDEFMRFGFIQPGYMPSRKFPLQIRGSDPCQCLDVFDSLYGFYSANETSFSPTRYFQKQAEISVRMRTILVDWIVEVHCKYKLHPLTLWLTVNLIDRYLERVSISRCKLQLVGITALFIACKYEEVQTPEVRDCVYLTDNAYTKEQILAMELHMLEVIDFQLQVPTTYHFLAKFLHRIKAVERLRLIVSYVAERNLYEADMLDYKPSIFAAASLLAGLQALYYELGNNRHVTELWPPSMQEESGYTLADILPCAKRLLVNMNMVHAPSSRRKIDAVRKKYETPATQFVCNIAFPGIPNDNTEKNK